LINLHDTSIETSIIFRRVNRRKALMVIIRVIFCLAAIAVAAVSLGGSVVVPVTATEAPVTLIR
jgi:hypothetical protein